MWKPILILASCAACGPSTPALDHKAVLIEVTHFDGPQPVLVIPEYHGNEVPFELHNDTEREFYFYGYRSGEPCVTRHSMTNEGWGIDQFAGGPGLEYQSILPGAVVRGSTGFRDPSETAIRFTLLLSVTRGSDWVPLQEGDPSAPFHVSSRVLPRKEK